MDSIDFYCDDDITEPATATKCINKATAINPNIMLSESSMNRRKSINSIVGAHNPLIGGANLMSPVGGGDVETETDVSHNKLKAIEIDRNKGLKLSEDVAGKILPTVVSFMDTTEAIAIPTLYELMSDEFGLMPDTDLIQILNPANHLT